MSSSPAVQRAPSGGTSGGVPVSRPGPEWRRSGEPGSAFSGLGRGRGRGGSRGGRGGRGGGRGAKSPLVPVEQSSSPAATSVADKPTTLAPISAPPVANKTEKPTPISSAAAPTPSSSRSKASRRTSKNLPSVVVAPSIPATTDPPSASVSATSTRPSNNRKRSRTQSKASNTASTPKARPAPLDSSLLYPGKGSRIRQAPLSAPIKDVPPHLAEKRHDIDALVERMRSVAMADNRPSTPGSHIDWAGDEDDSLPDLDDWGVKTPTAPETDTSSADMKPKDDLISPIIVDGLRSLPEPVVVPLSPSPINKPGPLPDLPPKDVAVNGVESPTRAPLHPSLPPKPVVPEQPRFNKTRGAAPMRNLHPRSPPSDKVHHNNYTGKVTREPGPLADNPAPVTPPPAPITQPEQDSERELTSLEKRMSTPPQSNVSHSAPNDVTTFSNPPSFYLTHGRAHTMGRPPTFLDQPPHPRHSRSGGSTPRGGLSGGQHHARTHSSPPATHRIPHSRPVLTGDALSRLARTIGGATRASPPAPPIVAVAAASKE